MEFDSEIIMVTMLLHNFIVDYYDKEEEFHYFTNFYTTEELDFQHHYSSNNAKIDEIPITIATDNNAEKLSA